VTKFKPFIPRLKIERVKELDPVKDMETAIKRHLKIKGHMVVFDPFMIIT